MPRWRWCWRRKSKGRPPAQIFIYSLPKVKRLMPIPCLNPQPIEVLYPEYEAIRLVDYEGLTQEEAAKKMGVSRGTIWRLLESGRKKVLEALITSRPLLIADEGELIEDKREVDGKKSKNYK